MIIRVRGMMAFGLASLAIGCGSDDGGSGGGGSYSAISAAIEAPTGTVDETSAPKVAEEFERIDASGASGLGGGFATAAAASAVEKQTSVGAALCTEGGDASFDGDENAQYFSYDSCCFGAAYGGCCYDGTLNTYVDAAGGSYTQCMDYDLRLDCGAELNTSVTFEGCQGPEGLVYVIRVDGMSFAVTGSYSNGSGSLSITGENGSYECTWTAGSGSCTGTGGSFDVGASS